MPKYTLLFPTVEEMAEMLYKAGWSSPCDAQWEKLEGVMRDVRAIVESDALKQREAVPDLQQKLADVTASFKNFHANLCKRFGYAHDEIDWRRDLASLEEWIAKDKARMDHISAKFILASRAKHPEDGLTWLAIDGKTVRKETLRDCIDELLAFEKQIS